MMLKRTALARHKRVAEQDNQFLPPGYATTMARAMTLTADLNISALSRPTQPMREMPQ
jgi:hypothetical protein